MAPHSSILAREIPWTQGPGSLQSMGSQRVGHGQVSRLSLLPLSRAALWGWSQILLSSEICESGLTLMEIRSTRLRVDFIKLYLFFLFYSCNNTSSVSHLHLNISFCHTARFTKHRLVLIAQDS